MFETRTPPRLHQHFEALLSSPFVLTRHFGNPCSKCKCKLVLGTTKGTFLSFQMKLNRFQGRSGVVKGEPWPPPVSSLYCPALPAKPSFSISHRGLSNPQHLSHFTTLMGEGRLLWRACCSRNCFQTSQSAVICNFVHLRVQFICLQFTTPNHRCVCSIPVRIFI